jgi:hypothetical protein
LTSYIRRELRKGSVFFLVVRILRRTMMLDSSGLGYYYES